MRPAGGAAPPEATLGQADAGTPGAALIFLAFAASYFGATLLRAITATLAPVFSDELGLGPADLGLLAAAYFLGFAAMQLPLGRALDRHGPRRTLLALLAVAVAGCGAFALAGTLTTLTLARMLIGAGVAACLMAPLTLFRRRFTPAVQLRFNAWMLMTGSLGMLASTLPVQWLLPLVGWRGLFWAAAAGLAVAMALIWRWVPRDGAPSAAPPADGVAPGSRYRDIARHPLFLSMAPLAFVLYGGLVAVQSLWAGPWLTRVGGATPAQAAAGLFLINAAMLLTFLAWGLAMPRLAARGITPQRLMTWGLPVALALMVVIVVQGAAAGPWHWAAWCMACTFASVSQPAVGQAFDAARAGRALSAFNLVIFSGVFCVQWCLGLATAGLMRLGWSEPDALRSAFALFNALCLAAYLWFLWRVPRQPAVRCP